MKIAVVDDLKNERTLICQYILKYFHDRKDIYEVSPELIEFVNGEAFLSDFKPRKYEIVFLDIYMEKLTGIDVAKKIAALDRNCSIIFFTTSNEHQLDGYGVHAVGYVMKPVSEHLPALYTAMDYAASKLQMDQGHIIVKTSVGELDLYYRNILYIDCIDRIVHLHLTDKVLKLLGKYDDYEKTFLSDSRFLECYRNIIVNMDYIDIPMDYDFILKSGEKLPISRRKKNAVLGSYMSYFLKKRG